MERWLILLGHTTGPYYYAGRRNQNSGSVWVPRRNSATKFLSRDEAESYALIIAVEEPETIAKLSVVNYDEARDGAPSVDDRKAGKRDLLLD